MKIKNLVDKTTSFLFKRLTEATGLALLVLSVLLLISLISYSSAIIFGLETAGLETDNLKMKCSPSKVSLLNEEEASIESSILFLIRRYEKGKPNNRSN